MKKKCGPIDERGLRRGSIMLHFLVFGVLLLAGCGGSSPPLVKVGTASGKLAIPPDHIVEMEPNDTPGQAQAVSATLTIAGSAAESDPGFLLPREVAPGEEAVEIGDLYRLSVPSGKVRITLSIAANDAKANDLDLFLLDEAGAFIDSSEGIVSTEMIETPGPGSFLIGVRAFQGTSAYVLSLAPLGTLAGAHSLVIPPGAEFVPGEVIVKLKSDRSGARRKPSAFAAEHQLAPKHSFPQGVALYRVSPSPRALQKSENGARSKLNLPKSAENALKALTFDTIQKLRRDPEVDYAEANLIRHPSALPNDEHYHLQWDYSLINLPQAWEVTHGSGSVIVAVIDTGVLPHPDLSGRVIAGYDFISDPAMAGDGDGLDADATDAGDDPKHQSSSFHGTHVAGTIGAATNNGVGVAGITWEGQIMPIRALGFGGGTDADISQAIRYAAGLENSSGTIPPQRADIINMSLGGNGFSQTQQDAITAARNAGVLVVAAAGNENAGTFTSPASLEGVISVAAVDLNSKKAPYSNYGPAVDVAAPGGNGSADLNGDRFPDGILSSWGEEAREGARRFSYRFMQGTSMAAPHVAGVLALMRAVNPALTPDDVDRLLAGTHPATTIRITRDLGAPDRDDLYGHGLIDAAQAVIAAKAVPGGTGGIAPTGSILAVSNLSLDFSNFIDTLHLDLTNAGIGALTITAVTENPDVPWLTVAPASGAAPLSLTVTLDRSGLPPGDYSTTIDITSDASRNPTAAIPVKMRVGGSTEGNVGVVFVLVVDKETLETVRQAEATAEDGYAFTVPRIPVGTYRIAAGTDRDDDGLICDTEDACGFYPDLISVMEGQDRPDIDFTVGELVSPQSLPSKAGDLQEKKLRRLR
jgi:serine protease